MRKQFNVTNVYKRRRGSILRTAVTTTSPEDGGYIEIESDGDFDTADHSIQVEGTAGNEVMYFRGITVVDDTTSRLTGITRPNTKRAHASGSFVQAGSSPFYEKIAVGYFDDEDDNEVVIHIREDLWPAWKKGQRDAADVDTCEAEDDDDAGEWLIVTPPIGKTWTFDFDAEHLSSNAVTPVITATVTPIGIGDSAVPTTPSAAPVITQGPNMHLVDMRAYTKPTDWLAFVVEYSTNAGANWTSLGDVGSNIFAHTNLSLGTAYRYRFSVKDSEGNTSAVSAATADYTAVGVGTADLVVGSVTATILASTITISNTFQTAASGSRVMFDGSGIRLTDAGGTTVADLNASTGVATLTGAVYKSATGTGSRVELDSSGLRFYNSSNVLKVELKTSDSSATFTGSITGASIDSTSTITGATITGGTVQTATSGDRVVLTTTPALNFYKGASLAASLTPYDANTLSISQGLRLGGGVVVPTTIYVGTDIEIDGALNHDGTTVGFYGVAPTTRISMTNLSGSDSTTAQLHSKLNNLLDNLRTIGLLS